MPRKPLPVLQATMSAAAQERSKARARDIIDNGMTLRELRDASEVTQTDLATRAKTTQSEISKIEQRTDLMVSTLRDYLHGLGAELELVANFPDGGAVKVKLPGEEASSGNQPRRRMAAAAR